VELTYRDQNEIRSVIREQLDALRTHDPERALACATPKRRSHGTPGHFMETIARTFPQLIHTQSAVFGQVRQVQDFAAQSVQVIASDGSTTSAVYILARQPDGSWLIDSCVCKKPEEGAGGLQYLN
jgi:hypothetical protein